MINNKTIVFGINVHVHTIVLLLNDRLSYIWNYNLEFICTHKAVVKRLIIQYILCYTCMHGIIHRLCTGMCINAYTYKLHMYIIQTESRVFTGFKDRDKKPRRSRGFLSRLFKSRKHEGEVCIIFKSMQIKTELTKRFCAIVLT